jgi:hypothetical protein
LDARQARGLQVGDRNTQTNYFFGRAQVDWPHQVGVVPPLADCRQERPADDELATVVAGAEAVVVCQVLAGLGGVGKTQLAASLAHRLRDTNDVDLLVWVTATSRVDIVTRYAQAAADITGFEDSEPEQGAARFVAWLSTTTRRWLVVLDDLADPNDVTGLWPPTTASGRTVVTTRRRDAALLAGRHLINVDLFTADEAGQYLHDKFADYPHRLDDAEALAADLGHLPLALAQAATYIADQGLTCADYRWRLGQRKLAQLAPNALPDDYRATVSVTFSLSIDLADTLEPVGLARPIAELAALRDPNASPPHQF